MSYFLRNIVLLIDTIINVYIYLLIIRFMLQLVGVNYRNSAIQLVVKFTDVCVKPVSKILPHFRQFNLAAGLLIIVFQVVAIFLIFLFEIPNLSTLGGMLLIALGALGKKIAYVYIVAIIVQAVGSWIPMLHNNPVFNVVYLLVSPVTTWARRIIPPMGGLDFSLMLVLFILYIIISIILDPLMALGLSLVSL